MTSETHIQSGRTLEPELDGSVRVSVVVPAFNEESRIGAALQSVLDQTIADFEIIVVDDCSSDRTEELVIAFARRDRRVIYFRMPLNCGPAACRNKGFSMARGRWIALLDADDRYAPSRLERLLAIGEAAGAQIVADDLLLCADAYDQGRPMISAAGSTDARQLSFQEFMEGCCYEPGAGRKSFAFLKPIFRKDFLRRNNIAYEEGVCNGEDLMMYVQCFLSGAVWLLHLQPLYLYTVRPGSLVERSSAADQWSIIAFARKLALDPRVQRDAALRRSVRRFLNLLSGDYIFGNVKCALMTADFRRLWSHVVRDTRLLHWLPLEFGKRATRRLTRRPSRAQL